MTQDPLDEILAVDTDEEVRPGFDTRFHARLAEAKNPKPKKLWWVLVPAVSAAAFALGLMVFERHDTQLPAQASNAAAEPSDIDVAIALDYDMLANYDVVAELDTIETFELLAQNDVPSDKSGVPQ